ncbi:MAG: 50S ribosomal protein L11 methyltransferase [Pseudomonadota bacterium]
MSAPDVSAPGAVPALYQIRFPVRIDDVDAVFQAVDEASESIAVFEEEGRWFCELLVRHTPDLDELAWRLSRSLGEDSPGEGEMAVEALDDADWLEATRRSFPPFQVGRFWVHGSHVQVQPPPDAVQLAFDAGLAFGTGEHGSTQGCLLALDQLLRRRRFRRILDMGCGSAILAVAATKCQPSARALAVDIDPQAVRVAADNAVRNGVATRLRTAVANGYDRPALRRAGRFDLIFANILAGPLCAMAGSLAHALSTGGTAVVSGLISNQTEAVLLAHRRQGLTLVHHLTVGSWSTLVFDKQRARPLRRPLPNPFTVEAWPTRIV